MSEEHSSVRQRLIIPSAIFMLLLADCSPSPLPAPNSEAQVATQQPSDTPIPTEVSLPHTPVPEPTEAAAPPSPVVNEAEGPTDIPALPSTPEAVACDGTLTPAQTEGPYYTPDTPEKANLVEAGMRGTPLLVTGRVLNQACEPIPGAKLDFIYSPDGTLVAYPDRETGLAVIERLADGQQWVLDTQGRGLRFTPDSRHVIWTAYDEDAQSDTRVETTWLANVDGSDARVLLQARRTDIVAWLSADELLMTRRIPGGSDQQLFTLSLADGGQSDLPQVSPRMRGLTLSPDKRYLVYYVTFETESEKNGVWLVDLQNQEQPAQKLPFFGTYRWRDNQSLIYIPLDPDATSHEFYEYDILTQETHTLFPVGTNLAIANNDWQVSPDGRKIVMVAANGMELDGVWVLEIDQN